MPPAPVALNAGIYLDGALGGAGNRMILWCYEAAGVAPEERFRDLPDHVAMQIEFLAHLYERAARADSDDGIIGMAEEFCRMFVYGRSMPLEQACRAASKRRPAALVFTALVHLMRQAIDDPTLNGDSAVGCF